MVDVARLARRATGVSVVACCLLVVAVGVVSMTAESFATWTWYFRMEQAIALATPAVLVLLGTSILGGLAVVFTTPAE